MPYHIHHRVLVSPCDNSCCGGINPTKEEWVSIIEVDAKFELSKYGSFSSLPPNMLHLKLKLKLYFLSHLGNVKDVKIVLFDIDLVQTV